MRVGVRVEGGIRVRTLEPGDFDGVLALARRLPEWFNKQGLEEIARDLRVQEGWVALRGEHLIGWISWAPEGDRGASLAWMGVEKDNQGQGVGTRLLTVLLARLRALGKEELFVSTVADSVDYVPYAATRAFYRARGFADFRVDLGHFKDPRGDYDRLLLRRRIGERAGPRTE